MTNYGEKIPYTWHRHYTAFTGHFDANYFPELLYIPEFERFENLWPQYCRVFSEKNVLPMIAKSIGIKMPKVYLSCTKGMYRDEDSRMLSRKDTLDRMKNVGEVFLKPSVDSNSGKGCFIANFVNGTDIVSSKSTMELLNDLGMDFVMQERPNVILQLIKYIPAL